MNPTVCLISDQFPKSTVKIAHIVNILYKKAVKILIYVTLKICSDIIYAVQVLSEFSKNPEKVY